MTDGLLESFFKNLIRGVVIALAIAITATATAFVRFFESVIELCPLWGYNFNGINDKRETRRLQRANYLCRAALVLADISPPAQFSFQSGH